MYNRLVSFININDILSANQFGFQKNHSTYMAVMYLIDRLTDEMENSYVSKGIFIDLSQAFDTINHLNSLT